MQEEEEQQEQEEQEDVEDDADEEEEQTRNEKERDKNGAAEAGPAEKEAGGGNGGGGGNERRKCKRRRRRNRRRGRAARTNAAQMQNAWARTSGIQIYTFAPDVAYEDSGVVAALGHHRARAVALPARARTNAAPMRRMWARTSGARTLLARA